MNVLVINAGSTSLKYQLIDTADGKIIKKGTFERVENHTDAVRDMFAELNAAGKPAIGAIGHRVVHGGESFKQSTLVTAKTLGEVEKNAHLAPLHNPANILGIKACMKVLPKVPNVMVFDTAFHSDMPASAFLYALPIEDYKKHGIRRYGFHGTSHNFVSRKCAEMYGKPREELRIITCHLGGGCSICAVDKGKSVETSMGMTPLEGLVMGSRSGDVDPAVVGTLCKAHGFDYEKAVDYLNKECGLKGLTGIGSDMRDAMAAQEDGDENAKTAIDVFIHRLVKYIGAYTAVMGGADAIVWTGGIGNNNGYLRARVMKQFAYIGADIDNESNKNHTDPYVFKTGEISAAGAKIRTFVIKTDEEYEIAAETQKIVEK